MATFKLFEILVNLSQSLMCAKNRQNKISHTIILNVLNLVFSCGKSTKFIYLFISIWHRLRSLERYFFYILIFSTIRGRGESPIFEDMFT